MKSIRDLISADIPQLKPTDSIQEALKNMELHKVPFLPLVDGDEYLGIVSDTDLYDCNTTSRLLGINDFIVSKPYITLNQHISEIIKIASSYNLSIVPVLDNDNHFVGSVNTSALIKWFSQTSSILETGSIIVLEVNQHDYSMSEIAQIVEGNDKKILSMYITSTPGSDKIEITLKINDNDINSVTRTFERYGYEIKTWISEDKNTDDFYSDRYNMFIKYLNI